MEGHKTGQTKTTPGLVEIKTKQSRSNAKSMIGFATGRKQINKQSQETRNHILSRRNDKRKICMKRKQGKKDERKFQTQN